MQRIGPSDHLITWHKPKTRPQGLTPEEFNALPKTLTVREVHYYICIPSFRTNQVTLITTLLDEQVYSWQELLKIYDWRWQVEVNLRQVKTTLGMEMLRGKTPAMVRCGNLCPFDGLQLIPFCSEIAWNLVGNAHPTRPLTLQ